MRFPWLLAVLCLLISSTALAQTQNDKMRFGATGAEWAQMLATHDAEIKRVAQRAGLREDTLREIARELGIRNPKMTPEQFVTQIRKRAADAVKLREKVTQLEAEIVELKDRDLKAKADVMIERFFAFFDAGQLDAAEQELLALRSLQESVANEARLGLNDVVTLQGQFALSRGDFDKSAQIYGDARKQMMDRNRAEERALGFAEALVHMEKGDATGEAAAYQRALSIFEDEMLPTTSKSSEPEMWATVLANIATLQIVLTDLDGQNFPLDQLLAKFDSALEVVNPKANKPLWSLLLRQRARALQSAGNRFADIQHLLEAAETYETAISSYGRDEDPELWAQTQFFIGDLYLQVGARSADPVHLERSRAALELSLQVRTQKSSPLDWAESKIALANTYWVKSALDYDQATLQAALGLLDESLVVLERDRDPTLWSESFNIRGMIFFAAGERQTGSKLLELAAESFELALQVRRKENNPGKWAETMNGLGMAFNLLAQRTERDDYWRAAETAFRGALTIWTPDGYPNPYAMAKSALGGMLAVKGTTHKDIKTLDAALLELQDAGKIWTLENVPRGWATNQNVVASIFHQKGKIAKNKALIRNALAAYDSSRSEFVRLGNASEKLRVDINRSIASADLALLTKDRAALAAALTQLDQCNAQATATKNEVLRWRSSRERERIEAEAKEAGMH